MVYQPAWLKSPSHYARQGLSGRDGSDSRKVLKAALDVPCVPPTTRRQLSRSSLHYEADLTDSEWAVIAAAAA